MRHHCRWSALHPVAFIPTPVHIIHTLHPAQIEFGSRQRLIAPSIQLFSKAKLDASRKEKCGKNNRIIERWALPKNIVQGFYHRSILRKQRLPRSDASAIPDRRKTLLQQALKFVLQLIRETFAVASVLVLASTHIFDLVNSKFLINNLTRWIAVSLSVKLIMFHSLVTSLRPSLVEDDDGWFLKGSYRVIGLRPSNKTKASFETSSIPVRIRQVPGNGSCLFHAIAAGILFDRSISDSNGQKQLSHPAMSKVIEYSSKLRIQAVDTLERGLKSNLDGSETTETQLIMQNDETILASSLVSKAAEQYGMVPKEYLSNMRQQNVWGGGPEIVGLANCLKRSIVLLETIDGHDGDAIYLKVVAKFGPPSTCSPIYILSTNQKFPKDYSHKTNNHFLAVFQI